MKSKFLQVRKMLLVVAGLLVGASAWAETGDVTTNVDIDFSNPISNMTIAGTVGSMKWTQQWSPLPSISEDGYLTFGNWDGAVVELQNNNIGARDIVTISFELAFGKLTNKHVGIELKDTDGESILLQYFDAYNGDFDDQNPLNLDWATMYRGSNTLIWDRRVYFTITVNYATSSITTNTICYMSGTDKAATAGEYSAQLPSSKPIDSFVLHGNINNSDRVHAFDNLKITTTEGDYNVATAKYTVKYVCDGNFIKADDVREGDVDSAISLFATDKETFDVDGQRYIYVSDDLGDKKVLEDNSQVVTITFRKAEKYGYTVTSSYNNEPLPFSQDTQYVWEDENSVTVQCPKYYVVGTTLVVAPLGTNGEPQKKFTIENDGFVGDIEYTTTGITDIYLYSEAEDLEGTGLIASDNTGANDRVSCGKLAYAESSDNTYTLLSLPAGKYIFTLGAWGGASNEWTYIVMAGDQELLNTSCAQNKLTLASSSEFLLLGTTDITFKATNSNRTRGIDLIYVQKTGDVELPESVTATIGNTGWATFASSYDLNLAGMTGATAYYASGIDANVVKLTPATAAVRGGEGLILKGEPNAEVSIPVETSDKTIDGNLLVGCPYGTTLDANSNYYVLAKNAETGAAEFQSLAKNGATIPAGKAYLNAPVPEAAGARLSIVISGEATGIAEVEKAGTENDAIYNLSGQRVSKPANGLYIMNGKKVVIK